MKHRGRRTPPKYVRGTSDYDYYKEPVHYLERERQEREGCLNLTIYLTVVIIVLMCI